MSNPFDRILAADDLPSPPGVALRLLELYNQEDMDVTELAQVIQVDPVLSSKLINYCNSPILARSRKTTSVDQAVVALGLGGQDDRLVIFVDSNGVQRKKPSLIITHFGTSHWQRRSLLAQSAVIFRATRKRCS